MHSIKSLEYYKSLMDEQALHSLEEKSKELAISIVYQATQKKSFFKRIIPAFSKATQVMKKATTATHDVYSYSDIESGRSFWERMFNITRFFNSDAAKLLAEGPDMDAIRETASMLTTDVNDEDLAKKKTKLEKITAVSNQINFWTDISVWSTQIPKKLGILSEKVLPFLNYGTLYPVFVFFSLPQLVLTVRTYSLATKVLKEMQTKEGDKSAALNTLLKLKPREKSAIALTPIFERAIETLNKEKTENTISIEAAKAKEERLYANIYKRGQAKRRIQVISIIGTILLVAAYISTFVAAPEVVIALHILMTLHTAYVLYQYLYVESQIDQLINPFAADPFKNHIPSPSHISPEAFLNAILNDETAEEDLSKPYNLQDYFNYLDELLEEEQKTRRSYVDTRPALSRCDKQADETILDLLSQKRRNEEDLLRLRKITALLLLKHMIGEDELVHLHKQQDKICIQD